MDSSALTYGDRRTQRSIATNAIQEYRMRQEDQGTGNPRSTYLPQLVAMLAERPGIPGPLHMQEPNLDASFQHRGSGGFFDVFDGSFKARSVYRRVGAFIITNLHRLHMANGSEPATKD